MMKHDTAPPAPCPDGHDRATADLPTADPALWQAAVLHAPLPMIVHDAGGSIIALNQAFVTATGYTTADLPDVGAWLVRFRRVPSDDVDRARREAMASLFETDKPSERIFSVWTASGEHRRWRFMSSQPLHQEDGRRLVITTAQDVTETLRAARDLRESRRRIDHQLAELEALYAAAPIGLQLLDRDLRVVRINPALAELNGIPAEQHIGRNIFEIVPDLREAAEPLLRKVIATGEPILDIEFEGETRRAPGARRNWVEQFYPVKSPAGDVIGVGVTCLETTERTLHERRTEALNRELKAALDRLELVMRAAHIVVFAQDAQRRYTFISVPRWGLGRDEIIGLRDEDVLPEDVAAPTVALKQEVLATGTSRQTDMKVTVGGEEVWWHKRIEPLLGPDGQVEGLVGVSIDITERKMREQQVETLMRELAHRSKNLLAVIQGMARHSRGGARNLEGFLDAFEGRLKSLANSLDILEEGGLRSASMTDLIGSQIGHYPELLGTRIVASGPAIGMSPAAAQNIGMALHELSTNALKYGALSNDEGRIDITWAVQPGPDGAPFFHLDWRESGGPALATPPRRGFGRTVTEVVVPRAVHGEARWEPTPEGLHWSLQAPMAWIEAGASRE